MPGTKAFDRAFTKLIDNFEDEKKVQLDDSNQIVIKFPLHTMKDLTRCTIILETIEDNILFNEIFKEKIKSKFTIIQIKNMFKTLADDK